MSNKDLSNLLDGLQKKAEEAKSREDWVEIFSDLKSYPKPLKYNFKTHYIVAALGLLVLIFTWEYWETTNPSGFQSSMDSFLISMVPGALLTIIPLSMAMSNSNKLSKLADTIFDKDVMFDNEIEEANTSGKYSEYRNHFYDFSRGDEDRQISELYKGTYRGKEYSIDYELYTFSYVVVTHVPVYNAATKTTTIQRVETTHYRYGLVCPFEMINTNLVIAEDNSPSYDLDHEWETNSSEFNDKYKVYTDSEKEAVKFLSPSLILALVDKMPVDDVNLEFIEGKLCFSFGDSDLMDMERKYGLEDITQFEKEINSSLRLLKLNQALELVHEFMVKNDNNFKKT